MHRNIKWREGEGRHKDAACVVHTHSNHTFKHASRPAYRYRASHGSRRTPTCVNALPVGVGLVGVTMRVVLLGPWLVSTAMLAFVLQPMHYEDR